MASNPESVPVASGSDMASLPAVWAYILPALDHIMRSHSDDLEAPPLDVNYHMGVYTVVYNFATASRSEKGHGRNGMMSRGFNLGLGLPGDEDDVMFSDQDPSKDWNLDRVDRVKSMVGYELYNNLEDYFRGVAREVRSRAPNDDASLLSYYLAAFSRYTSGVAIINRLFAYLNRHFITRAVDEGMGWLSIQDVLKEKRTGKKTKKDIELLETRKKEILKQWGYDGGTNEQRRFAESCAEASSLPDRIVPVNALAHRCWRTEVIEPFLSAGIPKSTLEITNGSDTAEHAPSSPSASKPIPSTPASSTSVSLNGTAAKFDSLSISTPTATTTDTPLSKSAKKNKKKKKNAKEKGKQKEGDDTGSLDGPNGTAENGEAQKAPTSPIITSALTPTPQPPPPPPPPPKGRLNRVVGELILTTRGPAATQARETAVKFNRSLKTAGVSPDNIIRKRLDKYLKR